MGAQDSCRERAAIRENPAAAQSRLIAIYLHDTSVIIDALNRKRNRYAGLIKNEWAQKGRTLAIPDVLIAATALAHRLVLMTDNRKDFPMPQLVIYPL